MTTTVTITTHNWPVEVTVTVTDDYDMPVAGRHVYHAETSTVEPHRNQQFYLTNTRSLTFRELPIPHVAETADEG